MSGGFGYPVYLRRRLQIYSKFHNKKARHVEIKQPGPFTDNIFLRILKSGTTEHKNESAP